MGKEVLSISEYSLNLMRSNHALILKIYEVVKTYDDVNKDMLDKSMNLLNESMDCFFKAMNHDK